MLIRIFLLLCLILPHSNSIAQIKTSPKISVKKEVIDWSILIGIGSVNKFYLADLKPFPQKPLLKTRFKPFLNRETVPDKWIYTGTALINSAIFLLPNKHGWMNEYSYKHGKGFVESCAVYAPLLTTFVKLIVGKKRPYYTESIHKNDNNARKSFWSGHSSSTFSVATYFNLYMYKYITKNDKKNLLWKIPFSMLLYSTAIYTAKSRVDDHAHDSLDVAIGACMGTGMSILIFHLNDN